jgi:hypothetical protein
MNPIRLNLTCESIHPIPGILKTLHGFIINVGILLRVIEYLYMTKSRLPGDSDMRKCSEPIFLGLTERTKILTVLLIFTYHVPAEDLTIGCDKIGDGRRVGPCGIMSQ